MRVLFLVIVGVVAPAPVVAQFAGADTPRGMWWEVSASAAGARLTCALCDPSRELGPTLGVALGTYASPRLRMGVEGSAWTNEDGDVRESVYRAGLVAQLYPGQGSGLHVLAGLGWSGYRAEAFSYDAPRVTLGVGWDLPLVASWVAGSRIYLDGSSWGSLRNDGALVEAPVGLSLVGFGVYVRRR